VDEREVLIAWRNIFQADGVNEQSLEKAELLLEGFNGESPLHLRLVKELEELKKLHAPTGKKDLPARSRK
jgi:hypothetical protein